MKLLARQRLFTDSGMKLLVLDGVGPAGARLDRLAVRNGEDPGRQFARSPKRARSLPDHHHRIVQYLFDQLRTLNEVDQEPNQPGLIDPIQPLERIHVVRFDPLKQRQFVQPARSCGFDPGAAHRPYCIQIRTLPHRVGGLLRGKGSLRSRRYSTTSAPAPLPRRR